jgi:hypothetical protein
MPSEWLLKMFDWVDRFLSHFPQQNLETKKVQTGNKIVYQEQFQITNSARK